MIWDRSKGRLNQIFWVVFFLEPNFSLYFLINDSSSNLHIHFSIWQLSPKRSNGTVTDNNYFIWTWWPLAIKVLISFLLQISTPTTVYLFSNYSSSNVQSSIIFIYWLESWKKSLLVKWPCRLRLAKTRNAYPLRDNPSPTCVLDMTLCNLMVRFK